MDLSSCEICPRKCHADRTMNEKGICLAAGEGVSLARAALHFWEEPCISGERGSGAVFFCGCNLHCIYCQNGSISSMREERQVSIEGLSDIFLSLQEKGAENINLVTPTHYSPQIIEALNLAKGKGLEIPVVYNCGGYESAETLKALENYVDIYLTDFKYAENELAENFSHAKDYPKVAAAALSEMVRQCPECVFDARGMMKKGVIVRHLLLPGHVKNGKAVLDFLYKTYGDSIFISLMNQYTPMKIFDKYLELNRKVTKREYKRLIDFAISLGVTNCFIQEGETAKESFIPAFDFEGVPEETC